MQHFQLSIVKRNILSFSDIAFSAPTYSGSYPSGLISYYVGMIESKGWAPNNSFVNDSSELERENGKSSKRFHFFTAKKNDINSTSGMKERQSETVRSL